MGTKTISLEHSAYEKLRASKRRNESFSDVVHRLTEPEQPSLRQLAGWFDRPSVEAIAATVQRIRREDLGAQPAKLQRWGGRRGRGARQ